MQRWWPVLLAVLVLAAVFAVVAKEHPPVPSASAPPRDAGTEPAAADAGAAPSDAGTEGGAGGDAEAAAEPSPGSGEEPRGTSDAGATLFSGEVAPPIPADAPKSVVFGVILVQYKGAQGALPTARSREAARELAQQLAQEAKADFKSAVGKGDRGSMENAGRLQRGFLEPAPEYVLFTLEKGGVSEPVDTPRGFWIVRRIE